MKNNDEGFTREEVLEYFFNEMGGVQKTRKQIYIDNRNYVLAILYYEFKYSERELARIFEIDRTSVNYSKDRPFHLMETKDSYFLRHTKTVREKFPYFFPYNDREPVAIATRYHVMVSLDKKTRQRLKKYATLKNKYSNTAAAELIEKALNLLD